MNKRIARKIVKKECARLGCRLVLAHPKKGRRFLILAPNRWSAFRGRGKQALRVLEPTMFGASRVEVARRIAWMESCLT